jgi:hypothetical protein
MTPDVIQAQALQNFELLVTFADGERRRFSMLPYLKYPAYQEIRDVGKFLQAQVSNGTVVWSDEIDISPDTLYVAGQIVPSDATLAP